MTPIDANADRFTRADVARLWRIAKLTSDVPGLRSLRWRASFIAAALQNRAALLPLLRAKSTMAEVLERRPETLGAVVWPYVSITWDVPLRLKRIHDHWFAVENSVPALKVLPGSAWQVLDLGSMLPDLRLVIDCPKWFMREGQSVLNLFSGETRIFSLAFALRLDGALTATIGAIQGRDIEGALDTYRTVTGALHGMRPRDFLVEMFRSLCSCLGVTRIEAVTDASRHHRDRYFGDAADKRFPLNYDEVWSERGGAMISAAFFELPVAPARRSLESIASKKRSLYRKRYEMLDDLNVRLADAVSTGAPRVGETASISS